MKQTTHRKLQSPEGERDVVTMQKLDKANLVINQFIKSCSHSMRGPLKSIQGLVNLLKDTMPHKEIDPAIVIRYIEESTEKMELMLDQLEQFMFNSSKEVRNKSVDLESLIHFVLRSFQKEVNKKGIDVTVKTEQCGLFYSDPGRIRLILDHLLMNAVTFQQGEKPDKVIRIRCSVNEHECMLSIEDNGIGVAADQHENIFKMYYQATSNYQGAGIGLFVVREALEKIGGTVTIDSQPGQGSIFRVTIPNRH